MLEEHLSAREKLYLKRDRARWTYEQAAVHYEVSRSQYIAWEEQGEDGVPEISLGGLDPWEYFVVLRLRTGMGRNRLSRILGVSKRQVVRMEHGEQSLKRLIDYWGV